MRQGREAACFSVSSVMVFTLVQPEYMPAFLADDNLIVVTVVTGHLAVTVHFEVVDALLVIEICPKVFGDVRNVDLVDQSRGIFLEGLFNVIVGNDSVISTSLSNDRPGAIGGAALVVEIVKPKIGFPVAVKVIEKGDLFIGGGLSIGDDGVYKDLKFVL